MAAPMKFARFLNFVNKKAVFHPIIRTLSATTNTNNNSKLSGNGNHQSSTSNPHGIENQGGNSVNMVDTEGQTGSGQTSQDSTSGSSPLIKVVEMFERVASEGSDETEPKEDTEQHSFTTMLRNSQLIQLGDPNGRLVYGTITEIVGDDLYIDFGGKFHCVCKIPKTRARYLLTFD